MPGLLLGDAFPNFEADTTIGKLKLYDFLGDSWGILFSHPRDYTPVCTTELGQAAELSPEFTKRNVKMIALSIDSLEEHYSWSKDILAYNNDETVSEIPFPIIADDRRELAVELGMLDPEEKDQSGMPLTARCPGDCVMVPPAIPEDEARSLFPAGVYTKELPSGKRYLRYIPQP
ncbi:peroxiredoxin-6-like isoform X2 [Electrophorus electricus]|uniref:peroxiredoxin-6-like isoform X2 n=1 Tax=Electrophorus electricus TaxID=8005 RepID=UPI0015D0AC17|nr:peroxiredoxin-6-like isoform X2 [Electrophorus electricus]